MKYNKRFKEWLAKKDLLKKLYEEIRWCVCNIDESGNNWAWVARCLYYYWDEDKAEYTHHYESNHNLELAVPPVHHPLKFVGALAELTGMIWVAHYLPRSVIDFCYKSSSYTWFVKIFRTLDRTEDRTSSRLLFTTAILSTCFGFSYFVIIYCIGPRAWFFREDYIHKLGITSCSLA